MNKIDAISAIIRAAPTEPLVFTTGYTCRIARDIRDSANHFYMTGSMGLAISVGAGVAVTTGRTTVVVDGDGSVLMNPAGLIAAALFPTAPILHLVIDDGRYASTGGQATPSAAIDMPSLATALGYQSTFDVYSLADLEQVLSEQLPLCLAPTFVRCAVSADPQLPIPERIGNDLPGHARRFISYLRPSSGSGPCAKERAVQPRVA